MQPRLFNNSFISNWHNLTNMCNHALAEELFIDFCHAKSRLQCFMTLHTKSTVNIRTLKSTEFSVSSTSTLPFSLHEQQSFLMYMRLILDKHNTKGRSALLKHQWSSADFNWSFKADSFMIHMPWMRAGLKIVQIIN